MRELLACWTVGLYSAFGILYARKHKSFGNWICFSPQMKGEDTYCVGPLVHSLRLAPSKGLT
jgi:hypothetical protein